MKPLRHPFWQAVGILAIAYALIVWGIPWLPRVAGMQSAPVPGSVVLQYMVTVLVGVLIWVSDSDERWNRFQEPIRATMVDALVFVLGARKSVPTDSRPPPASSKAVTFEVAFRARFAARSACRSGEGSKA